MRTGMQRSMGGPSFLFYLYRALRAANTVQAFRYRINDKRVFLYDEVHASPTINRPDGTFGFAYMDYHEEEQQFCAAAEKAAAEVRRSTGLIPAMSGENVIHFSAMPWIDFTAVSHARCFSFPDSCPKISFGKMTEEKSIRTMPVSVHVHHALVDGYRGKPIYNYLSAINEPGIVSVMNSIVRRETATDLLALTLLSRKGRGRWDVILKRKLCRRAYYK